MTANSERVLNFLKEHYGHEYSKNEIKDALGISLSAVIGSINPLEKNGYTRITREEVVELEPATETRKAKTKVVKYHTITDAGLVYDPVAEEAKKAAEKEERRQLRPQKRLQLRPQKKQQQKIISNNRSKIKLKEK